MIQGPVCCNGGIRGYGNSEYGVVGGGIATGKHEALTVKQPFTGDSGRLLDRVLEACGWSRDKVYCTNLICWRKDEPDDYEMDICEPRLQAELLSLKPKLIIAMGKLACQRLFDLNFGKARGAV